VVFLLLLRWFRKASPPQQPFPDFDTYFSFHINKLIRTKKVFCADSHFYLQVLSRRTHLIPFLYQIEVVVSQETINELSSLANNQNKKNLKELAEIALSQLALISKHGSLSIIPITQNVMSFQSFLRKFQLDFKQPNDRTLGYYLKLQKDFNYNLILFSEEQYVIQKANQIGLPTLSFSCKK
jgi:hypothetical protein